MVGSGQRRARRRPDAGAHARTSSTRPTRPTRRSRRSSASSIREIVVLGATRPGAGRLHDTGAQGARASLPAPTSSSTRHELELDAASEAALVGRHERDAGTWRCCATSPRASPAGKPRAARAPLPRLAASAILGDERVEAVEVVAQRARRVERADRRASRPSDRETIPVRDRLPERRLSRGRRCRGCRSIDRARNAFRTTAAACSTATVRRLPGVYCAGWIKRGPDGRDRHEQEGRDRDRASCCSRTPRPAVCRGASDPARRSSRLLAERDGEPVLYAGWAAIDAAEKAAGEAARPSARQARAPGTSCWRRHAGDLLGYDRLARATADAARSCGAARRRRRSPTSRSPASRSPSTVARWLGRIKAAAARVNAELGLLDADKAERIAAAARPGRRRRARRPVPDRRLPDGLRDQLEHERERGDRRRSPARACTRTTT